MAENAKEEPFEDEDQYEEEPEDEYEDPEEGTSSPNERSEMQITKGPDDTLVIPFRTFNGEIYTMELRPCQGGYGIHDDIFLINSEGKEVGFFHFNQNRLHPSLSKDSEHGFITWISHAASKRMCFREGPSGPEDVIFC